MSRRRRGMEIMIRPMLIAMGLLAVYLFFLWGSSIIPGSNWPTIRDNLLEFWPWIIVLATGFAVVYEVASS